MNTDIKTWIFLRGLTRESRHWGDFVGQFQQALPDSRMVALDLLGNGPLNHLRSPLRVHDMVAHCRAQLALRNIKPPYHVLAMSLGGMVAVAWAHAHPQEVAANVLINTSMRPFSPFYQRLRPANYGTLLKLVLLGAAPEVWERTILHITSNRAIDAVLPVWLALRLASPVSRANALRQLVAAAVFRAPMVKPLASTLVLASEQDRLVSVECSRTLARHWQCALRLHPNAGHDLPLDDGPWVASQVRDWLTERHH
ncbi:MAG: alpha/beta hydrolase [Burkholderiaceae bacterium]|nr:alpha/beta hydrolase [Burkholderiaceae bacterium]